MGFFGFVHFEVGAFDSAYQTDKFVRATSCDIKVTQNIEKPNVIDGRFDRTVYQLGPKEVGGSVAFPAIYEDGAALIKSLWNACVKRNEQGRLPYSQIDVLYAKGGGQKFRYANCITDTFEFSVAQSGMVECTVGVIGIERTPDNPYDNSSFTNPNTHAVTWNDAIVEATMAGISGNVVKNSVRQFKSNVNNNSQRFYTLNGYLSPQDVAPTKRDITGSLTLMGRISGISDRAFTNM
jgi:hypothetical protein